MWPIQFAIRLRSSCRIFLVSLTLSNTYLFLTWSVQLIFSILLQHHISKLSRCHEMSNNNAWE
jgi:Zn-dependent protease with chaperone function